MPLNYGNGRFISSREAHPFGQSFDGLTLSRNFGDLTIDALAVVIRDGALAQTAIAPGGYVHDGFITGLWGDYRFAGDKQSLQLFWLLDNPDLRESAFRGRVRRHTIGMYNQLNIGPIKATAEGAYQLGFLPGTTTTLRSEDMNIAAFFAALQLGADLPWIDDTRIDVGIEHRSGYDADGDEDRDTDFEWFSSLHGIVYYLHGHITAFAGQFAYSGLLKNQGLQDAWLKLGVRPGNGFYVAARVHVFHETVNGARVVGAADRGYGTALGNELDIWATAQLQKEVLVGAGISFFNVDKARAEALKLRRTTRWVYLYTSVSI
jgi:hypothetical protein